MHDLLINLGDVDDEYRLHRRVYRTFTNQGESRRFLYTPIAGHVLVRFGELPERYADHAVAVEVPATGEERAFHLIPD